MIFEPQAVQEAKKTPTSEEKRSEKRRRRPRSAQERKIVLTWRQHEFHFIGIFDPAVWLAPPLRYLDQYFKAVY